MTTCLHQRVRSRYCSTLENKKAEGQRTLCLGNSETLFNPISRQTPYGGLSDKHRRVYSRKRFGVRLPWDGVATKMHKRHKRIRRHSYFYLYFCDFCASLWL